MNKSTICKALGIGNFLLDTLLQVYWIFGIVENSWIYDWAVHNSFLLWCFAEGIFGESQFLGWIALVGIFLFVVLSLTFIVAVFLKKYGFFVIPLFLALLNMLFHIVFYWREPAAYVGLLYKMLSCAVYACIVRNAKTKGDATSTSSN